MRRGGWAAVDRERDPARLVSGLDRLSADPFFQNLKARLHELLQIGHANRVLDVGCGTGDGTAGGCAAVGVDLSMTMLAEARRRHPGVPVAAADAGRLPLRDASVDGVIADRVVQHLAGADTALREWRRVLRPGGRVVTCDPDLMSAAVAGVDDEVAAAVLSWRAGTRPGRDTVRALDETLVAAGFVEVSVEEQVMRLSDLARADGIMGIAGWGELGAQADAFSAAVARRWSDEIATAVRDGRLVYTSTYRIGTGRRH